MMLRYMGWTEAADLVHNGMANAVRMREMTYDLAVIRGAPGDGESGPRFLDGARVLDTQGFAEAIVSRMVNRMDSS